MTYVTATGLAIKTIETILSELSAKQRADLDEDLNTEADSIMGQINGIFASHIREVWEVAEVAFNGFNPDAAEGYLLEKLAALTGTTKRAATYSEVPITCDLTSGTTLISGEHFVTVATDPDNRWTPISDYTAPSTGAQSVDFRAEFTGPVVGNAGTLTNITTTVTGWASATNPTDAVIGIPIDSDATLRQRREEQLRATGSATTDAIISDMLASGDGEITQCWVYENTTSTVDGNGLPAFSIEIIIFDGATPQLTDDEVAQRIWDTKAAGCATYGSSSGTATDSLGNGHTVYFTRPTIKEVYLTVTLAVLPDYWSAPITYTNETELKAAIVARAEQLQTIGYDVFAKAYEAVCMAAEGVIDITAFKLDFTDPPTPTANLTIGIREMAHIDTANIDILAGIGST